MKNIVARLKGIPSAVLVIGSGFIMAASADLRIAIAMSVVVFASLLLSSVVMMAIPAYAKLPVSILVITGFVSLCNMMMQAFYPMAVEALGVHVAALSVSLVAFGEKDEQRKNSVADAILTGLLFVATLVICAVIREVLGNATIGGYPILFLQTYKMSTVAGAFGGYLVLAVVVAVINMITGVNKEAKEDN